MTNYKNWKTAISTDNTSFENLDRMAKAGVNAIEVSLRWFDWHRDWDEIMENAKKAGIEVWSFHLPFANEINVANLHEGCRQLAVSIQKSLIEKISKYGVKYFVIHSSDAVKDEDRPAAMEVGKKSLAALAEYAAKFDAYICVENLPRAGLGRTVGEMVDLVSAHDRLRVCFDVNHLLKRHGSNHMDMINTVGNKIVTTHMSDYDFVDERHYFPGNGKINWNQLITALEEIDYNGPFLYEGGFEPSSWDPTVPYGTIEEAVDRHMNIKDYTGSI